MKVLKLILQSKHTKAYTEIDFLSILGFCCDRQQKFTSQQILAINDKDYILEHLCIAYL